MKKLYLSVLGILLCFGLSAQIRDVITFDMSLLKSESIDGYIQFSFEDCSFISDVGAPRLPYLKVRYVIPFDKRVSEVYVDNIVNSVVTGGQRMYPAQPEYAMNEPKPPFVEPDPAIYNMFGVYPRKQVEIATQYYEKGYHIVELNVYPLSYNPMVKGSVRFITSIRIKLDFENENDVPLRPACQSEFMYDIVKNHIRSIVRNGDSFDAMGGGPSRVIGKDEEIDMSKMGSSGSADFGIVPDYIIITNNKDVNGNQIPLYDGKSMTDIFQRLADWKTKKGVLTKVVTIDEISATMHGIDLQEKIRNYLKRVYNQYGTIYVLFGGDTNIVPSKNHRTSVTDAYYTHLGDDVSVYSDSNFGEWISIGGSKSEFYNGRAPVENGYEATIFVDKVIGYELMSNISDADYVKNVLFVAGDLKHIGCKDDVKAVKEQLVDNISWSNLKKFSLFDPSPDTAHIHWTDEYLSRQAFIARLNNGFSFGKFHLVYHIDHSGYTSIGASSRIKDEILNRADMDGLTNGSYSQILFTNGCSPGAFDNDCVIEHYINNPNGGGVAAIASSLEVGCFDRWLFNKFTSQIYDTKSGGKKDINNIGIVNDITFGSNEISYHLFGDPQMPIWTDDVQRLTVSVSKTSVTNTAGSFTVNVGTGKHSSKIMVCVFKDRDFYHREEFFVNANTSHLFSFNVNPQSAGDVYITVTGNNYLPYQTVIRANITSNNLVFAGSSIVDVGGNNNGKLDLGETVNFNIRVKNGGIGTVVKGVTAVLSTPDVAYVSIINPLVQLGNVYSEYESNGSFSFKTKGDIIDGSLIRLDVELFENGVSRRKKRFVYEVNSPDLINIKHVYSVSEDTHNLFVDLFNKGFGDAKAVKATLTVDNPNINIITSTVNYGDIGTYESKVGTAPFVFTGILKDWDTFILTITDISGKVYVREFEYRDSEIVINDFAGVSDINNIRLSWNSNSNRGYNIYRLLPETGEYIKLNGIPITSSFFVDENLIPNTVYWYKVSALNPFYIENFSNPILLKTSFEFKEGWPVDISGPDWEGSFNGSPNVIDVNGKKELFFTTRGGRGLLWGLDHLGRGLYDADNNFTKVTPLAIFGQDTRSTPALGDIDGDGNIEVVFKTIYNPNILVYRIDKSKNKPILLNGIYPWSDANYNSHAVLAPLTVSSPRLNILPVLTKTQYPNNRQPIMTLNKGADQFSYKYIDDVTPSLSTGRGGMAAVADLNGNGKMEIVIGYNEGLATYYKQSNGNYAMNRPLYKNADYPHTSHSVVLADMNGDGNMEIVFVMFRVKSGGGLEGVVCIKYSDRDEFLDGWGPSNNHRFNYSGGTTDLDYVISQISRISVGDLNNDNLPEVVLCSNNGSIHAWDVHGAKLPNFPIVPPFSFKTAEKTPILADIDGGDDVEIICSSTKGLVYAFKSNGTIVPGFPIKVENPSTPCVADIDGDGKNELIVGGNNMIYVWKTNGDPGKIEWGSERGDERNTGTYNGGCAFYDNPVVVSDTRSWTGHRVIRNDIVVKDGGVLSISDTVKFVSKARIIVERGGKLLVNNATLGSACYGEQWQGIEVWGNQGDSSESFGEFVLNNSKIEDAKIGVTLAKRRDMSIGVDPGIGQYAMAAGVIQPQFFNIDVNYSGGRITAKNSVFENNGQAVESYPYFGFNINSFEDCSFMITRRNVDNLKESLIYINGNNGITFKGCHWGVSDDSGILNMKGLYSINSHFYIYPKCSHLITSQRPHLTPFCTAPTEDNYSSFSNLSYGIYATGNGSTFSSDIKFANFARNNRAVYISGIDNVGITDCNIKVPMPRKFLGEEYIDMEPVPEHSSNYGIYINGSTGYRIEGNLIDGVTIGNIDSYDYKKGTYGIIINNSGADANRIYSNGFSRLQSGIQAQGENRDARTGVGLCFECNKFERNRVDISVLASRQEACNGVAEYQYKGGMQPAGNGFTWGSYTGHAFDMFNYTGAPRIRYSTFKANTNDTKYVMTQYTERNIQQYRVEQDPVDYEIYCPRTHYTFVISDLDDGRTKVEDTKGRIKAEVDGGNTIQLIGQIVNATSNESGELNDMLTTVSPYMSNESVAAAVDNEDAVTNVMVRDIVVGNSHAAREDDIITKIEGRTNPLPAYMYDQIDNAKNSISGLDILRSNLQSSMTQYMSILGVVANNMLHNDSLSEWHNIMENSISKDLRYGYAVYNVVNGDISKADSVLAEIEDLGHDYLDYISVMANDSLRYGRITEEGVNMLMSISECDSRAGVLASNILSEFGYIDYEEPIYPIEDTELKTSKEQPKRRVADDTIDNLTLYPNPAKYYITIEYNADGLGNDLEMRITNIDGKVILKERLVNKTDSRNVDVRRFMSGSYIVTICCEGSVVYSKKFIIR